MAGTSSDDIDVKLEIKHEIVNEEIDLGLVKFEYELDCSSPDVKIEDEGEELALKRTVHDEVVEKLNSGSDEKEIKEGNSEEDTRDENTSRCVLCKEVVQMSGRKVCSPCHKVWRRQHLERYTTRKLGSCLVCVNSVYNHIPRCKHDCTLVNAFVCSICESIFVLKCHLIEHMEKRYGKRICHRCSMSFCYGSDMKSHKCVSRKTISPVNKEDGKTGTSNFVCDVCQTKFRTKSSLERHRCTHDVRETLHECSACGKTFKNVMLLETHTAVHKNDKFKCNYCNKLLYYPNHLKKHLMFHMNKRKYKCTHCNMSSNWSGSLKRHLLIHENKRNYKCIHCKKSFIESWSLKRHLSIHENKRNYKCTYCNRSFNWSYNLKHHLLIHEDKRNYKCAHCNKSFNQSCSLKQHLLIHENKRNYKCAHCNKSFIQSSHLSNHLLIHKNKRNYICTHCNMSFNQYGSLKRHLLIHENKQNYKCTHCSKSFIRADQLKQHLTVHEKKRNYKCTHCKKSFNLPNYLKRHILAIHKDNKN